VGDEYALRLKYFSSSEDVDYAILSHTWGEEEILLADITYRVAENNKGYEKVIGAMRQARESDLDYIWIDTCCIDKTSSVELSEAINSMYLWYKHAAVCYVYLADVSTDRTTGAASPSKELYMDFYDSGWFTRGWTLQELLAPRDVKFFSQGWHYLGSKDEYSELICRRTKIEVDFLLGARPLGTASIAKRMSWSARRRTTRHEDLAYCMMGIFSVNMPLLYGEGGQKAFLRLQEEIMRDSDDESLFAWKDPNIHPSTLHGLLADHPSAFDFEEASSIVCYTKRDYENGHGWNSTNRGLVIELYVGKHKLLKGDYYDAALNCPDPRRDQRGYIGILLQPQDNRPTNSTLPTLSFRENHRLQSSGFRRFLRVRCNMLFFIKEDDRGSAQSITIVSLRLGEQWFSRTDIVPSHQFRLQDASLSRPAEHYTVDTYLAYRYSMVQKPRKSTVRRLISAFTGDAKVPNLKIPNFEIVRRPRTLVGAYLITHEQEKQRIAIMLGTIEPFSVGFDAKYMDTLDLDALAECYRTNPKPVTGSIQSRQNDPPFLKEKSSIELALHKIQVTAIAHAGPQVKVYEIEIKIVKGSPGAFPEFASQGWERE